jgi:hypothetical protein
MPWQAGVRSLRSITSAPGCLPAQTGPQQGRRIACIVSAVRRGKRERPLAGGFAGQLALHCAGETQRSEVAERRLAHSAKPFAPCLLRVEADIDADYLERDPQKGQ